MSRPAKKASHPKNESQYWVPPGSERFDLPKYGSERAPLHDPCVTAYLNRPWRVTSRAPTALFIRDMDDAGFYALLEERFARLP